jgi:hypothetical protein
MKQEVLRYIEQYERKGSSDQHEKV